MKISFVIPAYNVEPFLEKCIDSILRLDGRDCEVVIVDDGSRDRTGKIADDYREKNSCVKVIHQKNAGVSAARNAGMKAAKGEWICFVDGDDMLSPDFLKLAMPYLQPDLDICFFEYYEMKEETKVPVRFESEIKGVRLDKTDFSELEVAAFNRDRRGTYDYYKLKLSTPGKLYRRQFLQEFGILYPVGVPTGEDAVFNLYAYRHARKGVYLPVALYYHRVWGNSVSQGYNARTAEHFGILHRELEKFISSDRDPSRFREAFYERKVWSLGFCCVLDFCHPDNPNSYKIRKRSYKDVLVKDYQEAVRQAKLSAFRIPKAVLLLCMKLHLFWAVSFLCLLNRSK